MILPLRIFIFAYWLTIYCVVLKQILAEARKDGALQDSAGWVVIIVLPLLAASLGTVLTGVVLSGLFYVFTGYCLPYVLGVSL